ncbi:MAG: hypothetical protein HF981_04240 [Desulfobacteraceae bacterium]|nr:hypothetical protein [Desulfobacteraceae bacterium]MBC2749575.1 hypothetical protein [Desulfobacteraceae bacterium]
MELQLKRIYLRWLTAVALVWSGGRVLQHVMPGLGAPPHVSVSSGPALFILTAVCALAGPILYRTLFAYHKRACVQISTTAFIRFERDLILIGMAALALAMVADMLAVTSFYRSGTLLIALYAAYCGFPSQKRLTLDRRLYRVAADHRKPPTLVVHRNPAVRQTRASKAR